MTQPSLWALTGERGIGKTTFSRSLADQARAAGWNVAGLLSPAVFENGIKTGILAENLRTRETRLLAVSASTPNLQHPAFNLQPQTFDLSLGNWLFNSSTLDWGNQILMTSLPCDLFIVDEIGPLELLRREGWMNALEVLRQRRYQLGLGVVRPELIEVARQNLPITQVITLLPLDDPVFQAHIWWKTMLTHT